MNKFKLVIFGAAEQAELAGYLFEHDSSYEVVAYCVHQQYLETNVFNGKPIVPFEQVCERYPPEQYPMFIALGYTAINKLRTQVCQQAKAKGYKLVSYVSSLATTWPDFRCGENCLILEGNNIQPFVVIGNNVTLWSGNHIGHHSIICDNVFITSHVVVSGGCTIGENTFIGVNATLRDHIIVERENVIAAGALLTKSTEAYGVYIGSPAKKQLRKSFELEGL